MNKTQEKDKMSSITKHETQSIIEMQEKALDNLFENHMKSIDEKSIANNQKSIKNSQTS